MRPSVLGRLQLLQIAAIFRRALWGAYREHILAGFKGEGNSEEWGEGMDETEVE